MDRKTMLKMIAKRPKKRLPTKPSQPSLFNADGYSVINLQAEIAVINKETGEYKVRDMIFSLSPPPKNKEYAFGMVLDAMRSLHGSRKDWKLIEPGRFESFSLESFFCYGYDYTFRTIEDGPQIRIHFNEAKRLEISLPKPGTWRAAGLFWLHKRLNCCAHHARNPRPWEPITCNDQK